MLGADEIRKVVGAVRKTRKIVITAPAGSGKSTRLPWELAMAGLGPVYVVQSQAIIAKLHASMASDVLGEEAAGNAVGHWIPHDFRPGRMVTYVAGDALPILMRRHPGLQGIGTLMVDDAHEWGVWQELAIAWAAGEQARGAGVPLVVLSSFSNVEKLVDAFPDAEWLDFGTRDFAESDDGWLEWLPGGRKLEVRYLYDRRIDARGFPSLSRVSEAIRMAVSMMDDGRIPRGNILVILPGVPDVRRWAGWARREMRGWVVCEVHGLAPEEEIRRAVCRDGPRRIIFTTSLFETALSFPGVTAVVDTGAERWDFAERTFGVIPVETAWASRPDILRRALHAGCGERSTGHPADGVAIRLYSPFQIRWMPSNRVSEIGRIDSSGWVLFLQAAGVPVEDVLRFLPDAPSARELREGLHRLTLLGALDEAGGLTDVGRLMAEIPLDASLAWLVVRAIRGEHSQVIEPLLMGLAVLSVTEGQFRFPDEGEEGQETSSPLRQVVSKMAAELGSEIAAYAVLLFLYHREGNGGCAELGETDCRRSGFPWHAVPVFPARFWHDNCMEDAWRIYKRLRAVLEQSGLDIPAWDGKADALEALRRLLVVATANRVHFNDFRCRYYRVKKTGDLARRGLFFAAGFCPRLIIPLGERRTRDRNGELFLFSGVTGVKIPDDLRYVQGWIVQEYPGKAFYDPQTQRAALIIRVLVNQVFAGEYKRLLPAGREAAEAFAEHLLEGQSFEGVSHLAGWAERLRSELFEDFEQLQRIPETKPLVAGLRERAIGILANTLEEVNSLSDFRPSPEDVERMAERIFGEEGIEVIRRVRRFLPKAVGWGEERFPVMYRGDVAVIRVPVSTAWVLPPDAYVAFRAAIHPHVRVTIQLEGTNMEPIPAEWDSVQAALLRTKEGALLRTAEEILRAPLLEPASYTGLDGKEVIIGYWGMIRDRNCEISRLKLFRSREEAEASLLENFRLALSEALTDFCRAQKWAYSLQRLIYWWLVDRTSGWNAENLHRLREPESFQRLVEEVLELEGRFVPAVLLIEEIHEQMDECLRSAGVPWQIREEIEEFHEEIDNILDAPWESAIEKAEEIRLRWENLRKRIGC